MKKINIILTAFAVLAGGFFLYVLSVPVATVPAGDSAVLPSVRPVASANAKTNSEGGVDVTAVPPDFSTGSPTWDFGIELTTHSGDLNEDLTQISVLAGDDGKEYASLGWEGDPLGGHHRGGILKFKPISPLPASVTLVIKNLRGVPERRFVWQMKTAERDSHIAMDLP